MLKMVMIVSDLIFIAWSASAIITSLCIYDQLKEKFNHEGINYVGMLTRCTINTTKHWLHLDEDDFEEDEEETE